MLPVRPAARPRAGFCFFMSKFRRAIAPKIKRTVAFVDGQNLYHTAKQAFGYTYPNYDVFKLAQAVCTSNDWQLDQVYFYTGIPDHKIAPAWHTFWANKLAVMGTQVNVFTRPLRYHKEVGADGNPKTVGDEKGIDVRIAIDIIGMAHRKAYDVALIFSQDQDLSEVADEIHNISIQQNRWIKVASAFPVSDRISNARGINNSDWIRIDRATYDTCIDPLDYR